MVMAGRGPAAKKPSATPDEAKDALAGNLCRCGTHQRILQAVMRAAGRQCMNAAFARRCCRAAARSSSASRSPGERRRSAPPRRRRGAAAAQRSTRREVDGFLAVNADGSVTVFCGKVDLGQGLRIAIPQMAAEELGVAVERIR